MQVAKSDGSKNMGVKYVRDFDFPADRGFHGSNKMPSNAGASERDMPARVGKAVGAPRMESMPRVGKAQGYAHGGSVKKLADGGSPLTKAQQRTSIRNMGRYVPRDYLTNPNRIPTEREMSAKAAIRQSERITREAQKKVAQEAAREAAKAAALKTLGKVAARAIPGVGAALTAYDVGKYAYDKYKQNQARKKPTVTVEQVPDSGAPPASGGGMGITSGGAMARGMPTSGLPDKRGSITVEEMEDTGGMKRGGSVKGKKIAKVMREYKEGKLHSGSKKGPKVTNPKQAMAIALAQSRSKKAEGGLTSYEESGSAGGSNVSFKEAFRKAREQGLKEFSWKGDRYTTKVREESSRESKVEDKAPRAEMGRKGPESRGGKRNVTEMSEYKRERKTELPSDRGSGFRSQAEETGMSASERADKARGYAENLMGVAGAGALLREPAKAGAKALMRKGMEFVGGRKMKKEAAETAARKSTPEYKEKAAQMEKFAEQMRARQKMGARYEDGGYVSKGPKTRYSAARSRRESKERAMERRALDKARHAEMYAPGMSLDMADRKNRGGMPVHRRKPMYGGGNC